MKEGQAVQYCPTCHAQIPVSKHDAGSELLCTKCYTRMIPATYNHERRLMVMLDRRPEQKKWR